MSGHTRAATRWESRRTAIARFFLTALARRVRHGTLTVSEDGHQGSYGKGTNRVIGADIQILDSRVWRRVLRGGGIGLGKSYFLGEWESTDLVSLLRLLTLNLDRINRLPRRFAPFIQSIRRPFRFLGRPTKSEDRANIAAHYDLGDEFFRLFLDPSMAYSSGVFSSSTSTLSDASREVRSHLSQTSTRAAGPRHRDRHRLGRLRGACSDALRMSRDHDDHFAKAVRLRLARGR